MWRAVFSLLVTAGFIAAAVGPVSAQDATKASNLGTRTVTGAVKSATPDGFVVRGVEQNSGQVVRRPPPARPHLVGLPSGHVLSLVVYFGLLAYLGWVAGGSRRRRSAIAAFCAAPVLLVAIAGST
jgi:membrane-associated phospholipid phosphatase